MGATSVMFRMHLLKHVSKGHEPFLPRNDGNLLAIQFPLPSKETKPYANQQVKAGVTTKKQAQASIGTE
jgi:hypothetical protein